MRCNTPTTVSFQSQTFHPFPRLPLELQLRIWTLFINSYPSRVVTLWERWDPQCIYFAATAIPSPLHTCSLSRSLALNRWSLSFASPQHENEAGQAKIFFDFSSDILWFNECWVSLMTFFVIIPKQERSLRRIAIDFAEEITPFHFGSAAYLAIRVMEESPFLEEVVCVGEQRSTRPGELDVEEGQVQFLKWNHTGPEGEWFSRVLAKDMDDFEKLCRERSGREVVLKYMDYTRDSRDILKERLTIS